MTLARYVAVSLIAVCGGCDNAANSFQSAQIPYSQDDYTAYSSETLTSQTSASKISGPDTTYLNRKIPAARLAVNYLLLSGRHGEARVRGTAPFFFTVSCPEKATVMVRFSEGARPFFIRVLPGTTKVKFWPTFDLAFLSNLPSQGKFVSLEVDLTTDGSSAFLDRAKSGFLILPFSYIAKPVDIIDLLPTVTAMLRQRQDLPVQGKLGHYATMIDSMPREKGWRPAPQSKSGSENLIPRLPISPGAVLTRAELTAWLIANAVNAGWQVWVYDTDIGHVVAIGAGAAPGEWSAFFATSAFDKRQSMLTTGRSMANDLLKSKVPLHINPLLPCLTDNYGFEAATSEDTP